MITRLLVALCILGGAVALPAPAQAFRPAQRLERCRYESSDGHAGWTEWEVRSEISCAVTKWPVPGGFGVPLSIALRETGNTLNPRAVNLTSHTCGLFQHQPSLWQARVAVFRTLHPRYRVTSACLSARSNALVSVWMMWKFGLGPWR